MIADSTAVDDHDDDEDHDDQLPKESFFIV